MEAQRLGRAGQGEGRAYLEELAGAFRAAVRGVTPQQRFELVRQVYQTAGLINADGSWAHPGFQMHASRLLPGGEGPTFESLIDATADASGANNFLMEFLGRVLTPEERSKVLELCGKPDAQRALVEQVAHLYMINQVSQAMVEDREALRAVVHTAERISTHEHPIRRANWALHHKAFVRLKFLMVRQPVVEVLRCLDAGVSISPKYFKTLLPLNIWEATLSDYITRNPDNGHAGAILARAPVTGPSRFTGRGTEVSLSLADAATYAKVYDLWNRTFMARHMGPRAQNKLIAPAVLGTLTSDDVGTYIPHRSYALLLYLVECQAAVSRSELSPFTHSGDWGGPEAKALHDTIIDKLGRYTRAVAEQYEADLASERKRAQSDITVARAG